MKDYQKQLEQTRKRPQYWDKVALMEFIEGILRLMREGGVSNAELAREYGAEPPFITNVLNGKKDNLQISTMNKLACALGAAVHIAVVRHDDWVQWMTSPKGGAMHGPLEAQTMGSASGKTDTGKLLEFCHPTLPLTQGIDAAAKKTATQSP